MIQISFENLRNYVFIIQESGKEFYGWIDNFNDGFKMKNAEREFMPHDILQINTLCIKFINRRLYQYNLVYIKETGLNLILNMEIIEMLLSLYNDPYTERIRVDFTNGGLAYFDKKDVFYGPRNPKDEYLSLLDYNIESIVLCVNANILERNTNILYALGG